MMLWWSLNFVCSFDSTVCASPPVCFFFSIKNLLFTRTWVQISKEKKNVFSTSILSQIVEPSCPARVWWWYHSLHSFSTLVPFHHHYVAVPPAKLCGSAVSETSASPWRSPPPTSGSCSGHSTHPGHIMQPYTLKIWSKPVPYGPFSKNDI